MHGGPPPGVFAPNSGRKYSLTLTLATLNALNRANFAPPNGDLSSPYFGQSRSLAVAEIGEGYVPLKACRPRKDTAAGEVHRVDHVDANPQNGAGATSTSKNNIYV
jgi:hypothetical protein